MSEKSHFLSSATLQTDNKKTGFVSESREIFLGHFTQIRKAAARQTWGEDADAPWIAAVTIWSFFLLSYLKQNYLPWHLSYFWQLIFTEDLYLLLTPRLFSGSQKAQYFHDNNTEHPHGAVNVLLWVGATQVSLNKDWKI